MYATVLSQNDSILGSLQNLVSDCVRDGMDVHFRTHSSDPQNHLRQEDLIFIHMFDVLYMYVNLIKGGLKDHLGFPIEGVQEVSLYFT